MSELEFFGAPRKAGFRKIFVPMEVKIPLDASTDLTLLPVGEQWMNELEFRVTLIDEHGDRSETPVSKIPILGSDLEKDLVQLGPRDRVAIVASDGASLALRAGRTPSEIGSTRGPGAPS